MFDRELALNAIQQIKTLVDTIGERTAKINDIDGFLCSPGGMVLLDAVCI